MFRKLSLLKRRRQIQGWIDSSQNLFLLRKRLKREIPRKYLRGFYKTWVYNHLIARLGQKETLPGSLSPLTIKLSPTMRCNLSCLGCFAGNYPKANDLSLKTMKKIVVEAVDMGIRSIGIIGGEPLLVAGIFQIFRSFPNVGFYLVTNGLLVNDHVVTALKELPHVVTIFSIEGFEQSTDYLRGKGVFQKVMTAMGKMKEAKLIFGFSTVVHKENLKEVVSEAFIDFMIECGCCFGGFLPYVPVGSSPRYHVVCGGDEVKDYYQEIDRVSRTRPILIFKEGYADGTFVNGGCGAGQTIHITSEGEAEPCNGIEFYTHNIHESSVREILTSGFFEDIRKLHPTDGKRCLVITEPDSLLRVVKKHNARATHSQALEHLQEYASIKGGEFESEVAPT